MSDPNPQAIKLRLYTDLSRYLTSYQLSLLERGETGWPGMTLAQASAMSIGRSLLKKLQVSNNHGLNLVAFNKFLQANAASGAWCPQPCEVWHQELVGSFKEELHRFWQVGPSPGTDLIQTDEQVLREGSTGPGSAVTARGQDFYTKLFDSPLGCTKVSLYETYERYCNSMPRWRDAEDLRKLHYGGATIVRGSRITFVPKNDQTARTICVEPNLNVLFQLGVNAILSRRLKSRYGIDLEVQQEKNRILARRGSRRGSDVFATVDLESASDSISANMLWHMLPPSFLAWLERYRSNETETPRGWQALGMISSMGNGYTFSLQTALFAAAVVVVYRSLGLKLRFPRQKATGSFGVNGDDIVVRREAVPRLYWLLNYLGFKVNKDKSFVKGPFRESCGGDYFKGSPIRGVYIKKMDTPQARYVVINRLVQFSARTGILLHNTMRYFTSRVEYLPVPWWEDDSSGIKTLGTKGVGRSRRYQSQTYVCLVPKRYGYTILDQSISTPRSTKRRKFNPDGLILSVLHGSVRDHFVGLRHESATWRKVRRIAPSWCHQAVPPLNSEMSLGGLKQCDVRRTLLDYGLV